MSEADTGAPRDAPSAAPAQESPAFPKLLRILTVVIVVDLVAATAWSWRLLQVSSWSTGSLLLWGLAALLVLWMGWWIVYSRTRLEGDVLTQTWLWTKRVHAREVSQLKLVHWRGLDRIVAPRLLVRQRNGATGWFQSADARLLTDFALRVAEARTRRD